MGDREPAKAFLYAQISSFNRPIDLQTLLAREEPAGIDDLALPVRMVVTDGDQLFPAAALRSVAPRYRAEVVEISGAGHSAYFEKPDEFNAVVDAFLKEIDWV
jgi:pimeloyl-ACP methyl ester carboxylesterase